MAHPSASARALAETHTHCEIPTRTSMHAALRAARIAEEAELIDRVARAAGLSPDTLAARAGLRVATPDEA